MQRTQSHGIAETMASLYMLPVHKIHFIEYRQYKTYWQQSFTNSINTLLNILIAVLEQYNGEYIESDLEVRMRKRVHCEGTRVWYAGKGSCGVIGRRALSLKN